MNEGLLRMALYQSDVRHIIAVFLVEFDELEPLNISRLS